MKISEEFRSWLKEYDACLDAWFDGQKDTIHIFSVRQGRKTLEFSAKREYGETYPELCRRLQRVLPSKDVWKRFGSGEAYEKHLHEMEQEHARQQREKAKSDRLAKMKDDKLLWQAALWNAREGRFTKETARPYEVPRESMYIPSKPKEAKEKSNEHDSVEHSKKEN